MYIMQTTERDSNKKTAITEKWKGKCVMEKARTLYVGVNEVCEDWGCSRSKGYDIIKKLSEQMHKENPKLLIMSGKINRIYYEEACMLRKEA